MNATLSLLNCLLEITALVCSIVVYFRYRSQLTLILVALLSLIVVFELVNYFGLISYYLVPGNLVIFIEIVMYQTLLYLQLNRRKHKQIVLIFLIFYIVFWCVNVAFLQDLKMRLQTNSYLFGVIGVLTGIMLYFFQELVLEDSKTRIKHRFFFWIYGTLFIFLVSEIPVMSLCNYMIEHQIYASDMPIFYVKYVTSMLYYVSYIPAIIWMKKL